MFDCIFEAFDGLVIISFITIYVSKIVVSKGVSGINFKRYKKVFLCLVFHSYFFADIGHIVVSYMKSGVDDNGFGKKLDGELVIFHGIVGVGD